MVDNHNDQGVIRDMIEHTQTLDFTKYEVMLIWDSLNNKDVGYWIGLKGVENTARVPPPHLQFRDWTVYPEKKTDRLGEDISLVEGIRGEDMVFDSNLEASNEDLNDFFKLGQDESFSISQAKVNRYPASDYEAPLDQEQKPKTQSPDSQHTRINRPDPKYIKINCPVGECGISLVYKHLSKHIKVYHGDKIEGMPFVRCPYCKTGRRIMRRIIMNYHIKIYHANKLLEYESLHLRRVDAAVANNNIHDTDRVADLRQEHCFDSSSSSPRQTKVKCPLEECGSTVAYKDHLRHLKSVHGVIIEDFPIVTCPYCRRHPLLRSISLNLHIKIYHSEKLKYVENRNIEDKATEMVNNEYSDTDKVVQFVEFANTKMYKNKSLTPEEDPIERCRGTRDKVESEHFLNPLYSSLEKSSDDTDSSSSSGCSSCSSCSTCGTASSSSSVGTMENNCNSYGKASASQIESTTNWAPNLVSMSSPELQFPVLPYSMARVKQKLTLDDLNYSDDQDIDMDFIPNKS